METLGKVLLQDTFTVWDPKHILKKGKERHLFLFEQALLLCKEIKDANGKCTFDYKCKLKTSEMGITEHVAEDKCKFAAWTGNPPLTEEKRIIKVNFVCTQYHFSHSGLMSACIFEEVRIIVFFFGSRDEDDDLVCFLSCSDSGPFCDEMNFTMFHGVNLFIALLFIFSQQIPSILIPVLWSNIDLTPHITMRDYWHI